MKLRTEKINAELQLLKAKVHPGFLFNTLNNIYEYAVAGSPTAAVMLLKLSDLLSYMLYECDQDWIPLDREIAMMNEYIELEKLRMDEEFEMVVQVKGVTTDKQVPPLLLLPFIENSFRLSTLGNGKKWMSMELMVEEKIYSLRIINGIPANYTYDLEVAGYGISTVQRRLQLLCPGRHELKMYAEQEMFVANFKVQFIEAPYNHDSYDSRKNRKKMANHVRNHE